MSKQNFNIVKSRKTSCILSDNNLFTDASEDNLHAELATKLLPHPVHKTGNYRENILSKISPSSPPHFSLKFYPILVVGLLKMHYLMALSTYGDTVFV